MLSRILPTTLPRIFCKIILYFQTIVKSITDPDDNELIVSINGFGVGNTVSSRWRAGIKLLPHHLSAENGRSTRSCLPAFGADIYIHFAIYVNLSTACIQIDRYNHTYIHTYIHTYNANYIHTYIYVCMYVCMYTNIHTYIHNHERTHAYTRTYIHTYIHTYINTCMHTYIHTRVCKWAEISELCSFCWK